MRILFVNPIAICFALLASVLLIIVIVLGGNLGEAVTMIFTPYLSDITERFGKGGEIFIQAISAIAQIVMIALIVVLSSLEKKVRKDNCFDFGGAVGSRLFCFSYSGAIDRLNTLAWRSLKDRYASKLNKVANYKA